VELMMTEKDDESVGSEIAAATGDLARNLKQETPKLQLAGLAFVLLTILLLCGALVAKENLNVVLAFAAVGTSAIAVVLMVIGMTRRQI
jgi:hypothetical protein